MPRTNWQLSSIPGLGVRLSARSLALICCCTKSPIGANKTCLGTLGTFGTLGTLRTLGTLGTLGTLSKQ